MISRAYFIAGAICLAAAQGVASFVVAPQRAAITPNREVYESLTPGEFAGTLMLGGFRGLACDLLWLRADSAKQEGRFYESIALFEAISRIQPRFEQPWQYMAWDLAYNLSHEVEDRDAKWSWIAAGIDTNVRGIVRNPQSERLLRHLAWMFHHKGDLFHDKIQAAAWADKLNPLLAEVNARVKPGYQVELLPSGTDITNFTISSRLYQACIALADGSLDGKGWLSAQFVRRMVPLAIESDGNLRRNQGQHLRALKRYLDALKAWETVVAWSKLPGQDSNQQRIALESFERNEGRLRRKAAQYCLDLAPDQESAARAAEAFTARRWVEVEQLFAKTGWRQQAANARIRWLDE
jgi:hypothetical protein